MLLRARDVVSRLSLATKLTLLGILTLLPLTVLITAGYLRDRDERREQGISNTSALGDSIAATLDGFAADLESFTLAAALALGDDVQGLSAPETSAYLGRLTEQNSVLRALFVTDTEGRVVAAQDGANQGVDLSARPYIAALQSGRESVWSGRLSGLQSGQSTAVHARVLHGPDGAPAGFLVAAFYTQALLARLPSDLPDDANLVLIDQDGLVAFSLRDPELANTPVDATGFQEAAGAIGGSKADFSGVETPFDSGSRFGTAVPVPTMGWAVAFTRSQSALNATLRDQLIGDLGVVGILSILSIGLLILVATLVTMPLKRLSTAAGLLAEGRSVTLPLTNTDPDVARLERAFIHMSEAVTQREEMLREQARVLGTLEQVGAWLASDLDFQKTVQAVTDAGTRLTDAAFGSFFYNVDDGRGGSYLLYTLSGAPPEAFEGFPMPRNTKIFSPTFDGSHPVRVDDVTADDRYGQNPPYNGMPEGHLPVRSYLAVPVVTRQGEVMGGLFFGHPEVGVFTQRHEELAVGVAAWAAIALDNARLYAEANQVQEELRRASSAKDEFLALISHELRTPTTTIYGGARLLQGRRLPVDVADELVDSIVDEATRMVRLIENLLTFARTEMGKHVDCAPLDLNERLREVLHSFERAAPGREVNTIFAGHTPVVMGEATYFDQVLTNLLSNAHKYSPMSAAIDLRIESAAGEVMVTVADRGPGVDTTDLDKIFESFYRSEHATAVAGGQGLGLTVCKRLVEAQGGRIWAANRDGGGLEVTFKLSASTDHIASAVPLVQTT